MYALNSSFMRGFMSQGLFKANLSGFRSGVLGRAGN